MTTPEEWLNTTFKEYCQVYWDLVPESELGKAFFPDYDCKDVVDFVIRICERRDRTTPSAQSHNLWFALGMIRRRSWRQDKSIYPIKRFETFEEAWPVWNERVLMALALSKKHICQSLHSQKEKSL